jgi:hypothetical protein
MAGVGGTGRLCSEQVGEQAACRCSHIFACAAGADAMQGLLLLASQLGYV